MRILLFTTEPVPIGFASTNRILSYFYGLTKNGSFVEVFSISPYSRKSWNGSNDIAKGCGELKIRCFPMSTYLITKVSVRIHRVLLQFVVPATLFFTLTRQKYDCMLFYGQNDYYEKYLVWLCKRRGIITLKEESEHPYLMLSRRFKSLNNVDKARLVKSKYGRYDVILVMTKYIYDFMVSLGFRSDTLLHVPQTVQLSRFAISAPEDSTTLGKKYILFTGCFSNEKDGVLNLIDSYKAIYNAHQDIQLVLAGFGTKQQIIDLKSRIHNLGLQQHVQIHMNLPNACIPSLIAGAIILVSARPFSLQAQYGFPTKVAEYLASGKPVVTSAHGDLSDLLIDGENAFILENCAPDTISRVVKRVLADYDHASMVGEQGRALARSMFDPRQNTKVIIDYCRDKYTHDTSAEY